MLQTEMSVRQEEALKFKLENWMKNYLTFPESNSFADEIDALRSGEIDTALFSWLLAEDAAYGTGLIGSEDEACKALNCNDHVVYAAAWDVTEWFENRE